MLTPATTSTASSVAEARQQPVVLLPTAREIRGAALARGQAIKKINALTAVLCGGLLSALLAASFPSKPATWLVGFLAGLLWANAFEYVYHRYAAHHWRFFRERHEKHHSTWGVPSEPEHVNFGGSPFWVFLLFLANSVPLIVLEAAVRTGTTPVVVATWAVYLVLTEEIHWRQHMGGWLPPLLERSRRWHLSHHHDDTRRFSVWLPLFDWLFGSASR